MATPVCDELPEAGESVMVEVEGEPETVTWLVTMDVIVDLLVVVAGETLLPLAPEGAPTPE